MLMADAIVTLITWLPYNLYIAITDSFYDPLMVKHSKRQIYTIDVCLLATMLSNCFTSPIVYYIFNLSFRVRKFIHLRSAAKQITVLVWIVLNLCFQKDTRNVLRRFHEQKLRLTTLQTEKTESPMWLSHRMRVSQQASQLWSLCITQALWR